MKTHIIRASERPVTCVKFNSDGDVLFTCGHDGMVAAWRVKTGERLGTYHFIEGHPDDVDDGKLVEHALKAHMVSWLDVTRESSQLAVAQFSYVVVYEALTGKFLEVIQAPAKVEHLEWNRNPVRQDKILIAHSHRGGAGAAFPCFKVYQAERVEYIPGEPREWTCVFDQVDFVGVATVCAWGPLDATVIGGTDSGMLYQWDYETKKELHAISAHQGKITALSFNKDRRIMLSVSSDKTAALWDVTTMTLIKRFQCDRPLATCALCPLLDAEGAAKKPHMLLAGGQEASEVTTTSAEAGFFETLIMNLVFENEVGRVNAHFSPTTCVAYHPNGTHFATGAIEGNAAIFEFEKSFLETDHNASPY